MHWPVPVLAPELGGDQGPVLVTVEYRVAATDRSGFLDADRQNSPESVSGTALTIGTSMRMQPTPAALSKRT